MWQTWPQCFAICSRIAQVHTTPFIWSLNNDPYTIYLAANKARWHHWPKNTRIKRGYDYIQLPWPLDSLGQKSYWKLWDDSQKTPIKHCSTRGQWPYCAVELFEATQEEWNLINQTSIDKWIDQMLRRLWTVIATNGNHTKW